MKPIISFLLAQAEHTTKRRTSKTQTVNTTENFFSLKTEDKLASLQLCWKKSKHTNNKNPTPKVLQVVFQILCC